MSTQCKTQSKVYLTVQLWLYCCCILYLQFAEAGPLFCTALAGAACIIIGMVSMNVYHFPSSVWTMKYESLLDIISTPYKLVL